MRAPRNPLFCRIRLFFFNDVFFNAKALTLLLSRRRRRSCAGISGTLPFITFFAHSLTQSRNSRSHFLMSCRLALSPNLFICFSRGRYRLVRSLISLTSFIVYVDGGEYYQHQRHKFYQQVKRVRRYTTDSFAGMTYAEMTRCVANALFYLSRLT